MTELTGTGSSELIAADDPVKAERARSLLRSAAKAVDEFEEAIRELVAMRAWTVLGYENLAAMWERENGFKCPSYAKVLAVEAMSSEGMKGSGNRRGDDPRHSNADVAASVGLSVNRDSKGTLAAPTVTGIRRQLREGIPPEDVTITSNSGHAIELWKSRARSQPRRIGKGPDELIWAGFNVPKRVEDAVAELARKSDVTKSEIYRQAVAEYLQRHNVSTHYGGAPNGATPRP